MIKKIQFKFIRIASLALFLVLAFIIGIINTVNYSKVYDRLYRTIDIIEENNGKLPQNQYNHEDIFNKETSFQTRYFLIQYDKNKQNPRVNVDHIALVDEINALKFGKKVLKDFNHQGSITNGMNHYAYKVFKNDNGYQVIFLDGTNVIILANQLFILSIFIGIVAFFIFVGIVFLLSKKAIKPIILNYERQNEFITNAGHELKTPLSVIQANMEVLEMVDGENEWIDSTKKQVQRLTSLVNDLITLVRFKEQKVEYSNVKMSLLANQLLKDFQTIALQKDLTLIGQIQKDIELYSDSSRIEELMNILLDNALKYCDPQGEICTKLYKKGKKVIFSVTNDYNNGHHKDYDHFFERFYRQEKSHNQDIKGFGIGLSMAKTIVENLKGKIHVNYKKRRITFEVIF